MAEGDQISRSTLRSLVLTIAVACLIALILLIPRLHNLDAEITPDEPRWVARSANFGLAIENGAFADTYQAPHPGVTVMWLGASALWLRGIHVADQIDEEIGTATVSRLFTSDGQLPIDILNQMRQNMIIANVALYLVMFLLLNHLVGRWIAAATVLFLGLDPMQIGFTRLLHMDGFSTTCLLVSVTGWSVWLITRSRPALFISAIIGGFGIATRSVDIMLVAFLTGIVIVDSLLVHRNAIRDAARASFHQVIPVAIWTVTAMLTFVALWPALWVAPLATLRQLRVDGEDLALRAHAGNVVYRGEIINTDPGPLFYPIMLAIRTTPLTAIGLLAALLALALPTNSVLKRLTWHLLTFAALYTATITIADKKLDRYALPTMGALNLIAILGVVAFGQWLLTRSTHQTTPIARYGLAFAVGLVLALQIGTARNAAPYYGDYISPLMGSRQDVLTRYSLFNGEGGQAIAQALAGHPEMETDGAAGTNWPRSTDFYLPWRLSGINRSDSPAGLTSFFNQRYLILTQPEIVRQLYPPRTLAWLATLEPVVTVEDQGQPISWIYDLQSVTLPAKALNPNWPAFTWENGIQLLATVAPDQTEPGTRIRLQTLWQAATADQTATATIALIDPDGNEVASTEIVIAIIQGAVSIAIPLDLATDLLPGAYTVELTLRNQPGADPLNATNLYTGDPAPSPVTIVTLTVAPNPISLPEVEEDAPET